MKNSQNIEQLFPQQQSKNALKDKKPMKLFNLEIENMFEKEANYTQEKNKEINHQAKEDIIHGKENDFSIMNNPRIDLETDKDSKTIIERIESEVKLKYNLQIPALSVKILGKEILLDKNDLSEFFSYFGEVAFVCINENEFYILYKFYTSLIFAYDMLNKYLKDNEIEAEIKLKTKPDKNDSPSSHTNENKAIYNKIVKDFKDNCSIIIPTKEEIKEGSKINKFEADKSEKCTISNNYFVNTYSNNNKDYYLQQQYNNNFYQWMLYCQAFYTNVWNYNMHQKRNIDDNSYVNTYTNNQRGVKYFGTYFIQIENDPIFNVVKRIIGYKGKNMKDIISEFPQEHQLKLRLRGKGSGYIEPMIQKESNSPLQLCVSSTNSYTFDSACLKIESLINSIYKDYEDYIKKYCLSTFYPKNLKMIFKMSPINN